MIIQFVGFCGDAGLGSESAAGFPVDFRRRELPHTNLGGENSETWTMVIMTRWCKGLRALGLEPPAEQPRLAPQRGGWAGGVDHAAKARSGDDA